MVNLKTGGDEGTSLFGSLHIILYICIMKIQRQCENCNKPFQAEQKEIKRGNARYCSLSCSAKQQRRKAIIYNLTCHGCNQPFQAKYKEAKYCSQKCKLVVYRRLQKSEQASIATFQRIIGHLPCEICGWNECKGDLHHITPVSKGGKTTLENLISLCPNHHRMAHKNLISQDTFLEVVKLRLSLHPEINQEQDAQAGN